MCAFFAIALEYDYAHSFSGYYSIEMLMKTIFNKKKYKTKSILITICAGRVWIVIRHFLF